MQYAICITSCFYATSVIFRSSFYSRSCRAASASPTAEGLCQHHQETRHVLLERIMSASLHLDHANVRELPPQRLGRAVVDAHHPVLRSVYDHHARVGQTRHLPEQPPVVQRIRGMGRQYARTGEVEQSLLPTLADGGPLKAQDVAVREAARIAPRKGQALAPKIPRSAGGSERWAID